MPKHTGLTAVLANPARKVKEYEDIEGLESILDSEVGAEESIEDLKARLIEMTQKMKLMEKQLAEKPGGRFSITTEHLLAEHGESTNEDVQKLIEEALNDPEPSVIVFFPKISETYPSQNPQGVRRIVRRAKGKPIKSQNIASFAIHYMVQAKDTGNWWFKGVKFHLASRDWAAKLGVSEKSLIATPYTNPSKGPNSQEIPE